MASNAENVSIWWRHHGWPSFGPGVYTAPRHYGGLLINKESYLYWTNSTVISPLIPNTTHPFNSLKPGEIGVCVNRTAPAVGEIMACRQFDEQVVISSNVDYLSIVSIRINFQKFQSKYNNFVQEIAFENNVWKLMAILSWPQYIKSQHKLTHSYLMTLTVLRI